MDITQVSSQVVYRNQWMTVREDIIAFADGSPGLYGVVDKPEATLVIPVTGGGVHLVEQYRYPIGRRSWAFPQGTRDPSDADRAAAARRELLEETGLAAGTLEHLGTMQIAEGFCNQAMQVFVATDLRAHHPSREDSEQDMRQAFVSRSALHDMVASGELRDAATLAAYGLLLTSERFGAPSSMSQS